ADALLDLERELPGGGEDQRADAALAGPLGGCEALEHGEDERGGLAGAGLGAGHEVATGQHVGNCLTLDGSWIGVALRRDGTEQSGRKPECREGHWGGKLLTRPSRGIAGPGQGGD